MGAAVAALYQAAVAASTADVSRAIAAAVNDFRIQGVIDADARRFQTTIAGVLKSFGNLRGAHEKTAATSRLLERQTRDLNHALEQQNRQIATLILNYRALRNAMLGLALTFAIAGFRGLTASIGSVIGGVVELTQQAAKLGVGLGVLGAAGLAAVGQGAVVAALGLKDLAKAFTTTGTAHEKAMAKLTTPARAFVGQLHDIQMQFRVIKLLAQQGLFTGVVAGVKAAMPVLEPLKQVVYDTAVAMGYLADRVGVMVGKRAGDLKAFGERNVVTLRRLGDTVINLGDAFLQVMRAADPFIGHVSRGMVTLSKTIEDAAVHLRKNGSLGSFFFDLQKSWDLWTSTFGAVATGLFHIFSAANDPANSMAEAIHSAAEDFKAWTGSASGQDKLKRFFTESNRVLGSMAKFTGALVKDLAGLAVGGGGDAVAFFDTLRTHVLPTLNDLAHRLATGLFPNLLKFTGALSDFIRAALPGLDPAARLLGHLVDALAGLLKVTTPLIQSMPGITKLVAAFAIGGGILGAWSKLTDLIGLAFLRAKMFVGLAPEMAGFGSVARGIVLRGGRNQAAGQAGLVQVGRGGGVGAVTAGGFGGGGGGGGARRQGLPYLQPGRVTFDAKTANALEREMKDLEALAGVMSIPKSGARDKTTGQFIPNSRYGATGQRTGAYRDFQNLDLTGKGGMQRITENVGGAIHAGVARGMRLARPVIGAAFAIGATSGLITALSSDSHGVQAKIRDFFSGATFGAVKTNSQRLTGNAQKLAAGIVQGQFDPNVGGAKTRSPVHLNLVNARDRQSAKDFIALLKVMGKISEDAKGKLVAMVDAFGNRVDKIGPQAAKLKGAIASGLDLGGVSAREETSLDRIKGAFADMERSGGLSMTKLKQHVTTNSAIMAAELGRKTLSGRLALSKNFKLAAAAVKDSMDAGAISTKTGTALIEKYLEQALMQFGLTKGEAKRHLHGQDTKTGKSLPTVGGGNAGAGAAGGALQRIPGQPGRDSVPGQIGGQRIVAAPGEDVAVINRHQRKLLDARTADLGGFAGVFSNVTTPHSQNAVKSFAKGGIASSGTGSLGALIGAANAIDARHFPYKWGGGHNAGFTGPYDCSGAWSAVLHAAGLLNAPETSGQFMSYGLPGPGSVTLYASPSHVYGSILGKFFGTSGQNQPGGGAGWFQGGPRAGFTVRHVPEQLLKGIGKVGDLAGGLGGTIKRVMAPAGLGTVGDVTQGALDIDRAAAQQVLDKAAAASGMGGGSFGGGDGAEGATPNAAARLAKDMAAQMFGWTGAAWAALSRLGQQESGWSTTALNPSSGAFGIGQFLGTTKAAYAHLGATSRNAGEQINAMLHYIKDRYGSPIAAWAHEQSAGWYEKGGLLQTLFASAGQPPIPPRGGGTPSPDPSGAVTPGSKGGNDSSGHPKKKKKKAHKKPPKPFAGHHPVPNTSGIKGDKPKAKARKKTKGKEFYPQLHGGSDFAEDALKKLLPDYDALFETPINTDQNLLTNLAGIADLTDEEAIVTLTDSGSFEDLTAFWAAHPDLAKTYKDQVDSFDVVNTDGQMVQGRFTPGISQHVNELLGQLRLHTGSADATGQGGLTGRLAAYMKAITTQGLPVTTVLRARAVSELKRLKHHWEMWQARRQHDNAEIEKLSSGGRSWEQRVSDNKARVKALQDYKRKVHTDAVGHRLTEADQKNLTKADQEIADLNSDSAHLRSTKPAPHLAHEKKDDRAHRLRLIAHKKADRDEALLRMDELAGSRDKWNTDGGLAKDWTDRVSTYSTSITDQQGKLADLQQVRVPAEQLTVAQIGKEIGDWQGTLVPLPKVDATAADTSEQQQRMNDLLKQQNEDLAKQLAVSQGEKSIFAGFAPLLAKSLVGAFEHGGVVPRTGLALVHQNETIIPDPRGPFGNSAAKTTKGAAGNVYLSISGSLAPLMQLIDARIGEVAPKVVNRRLGRDSRSLTLAPGR